MNKKSEPPSAMNTIRDLVSEIQDEQTGKEQNQQQQSSKKKDIETYSGQETESLGEQAGVRLSIHKTAAKKELIPADENVVRDRDIEIQSEDEYIPINIEEEVKQREDISLASRLWFYAKILFALFCVTIVMVAIYSNSEIWKSFGKLTEYIRSEETTARGAAIIGAIYILADFVFIPGSLYCVWAGFTFQRSF